MADHNFMVSYVALLLVWSIGLTLLAPLYSESYNIVVPEYPSECGSFDSGGVEITTNCFETSQETGNWLLDILGGIFSFALNGLTFSGWLVAELFFLIDVMLKVPTLSGITATLLIPAGYKILLLIVDIIKGKA